MFAHYRELMIIDSFITDALFIGCKWSNNIRGINGYNISQDSLKREHKITPEEIVAIKDAYRQLKISMSKHSDKIQENKFYAEELYFHNKMLSWGKPWENQFWDKIILLFSKTFSDYGHSFIKPIIWLLIGHYIFLFLHYFLTDLIHFTFHSANQRMQVFKKHLKNFLSILIH